MYIIISTQNKPCHLLSFNVCVYIERYVIKFNCSLLYLILILLLQIISKF